ncbi:NTRI-like protein, partial [Mya arenaria]
KPKVSVETSSITSREGDNVTLRCDIDAVPTVTSAYWLFKGAVIDRHYSNMANDSTTLYLVHVNISRADAGDYTCHVQNRIGAATSSPVAVTVEYAPVCSSGRRYAVSLGSRVSIACHMTGSPSNVTLTWRLAGRNVISETSSAENNRAFGVLEFIPRSPRDYGVLECYGENSVGVSSSPCLFDIVPPGPPQVPENCSTITNGNDVSIHCEPGFNGGSSQHFLLKILKINNYETVFRNDIAAFNIQAYENMTVRICAENIDYPRLEVCASPMEILVFNDDQGTSAPVLSSHSSKASRIAGGVTAAIGVVVIVILIVALLWRYRKDASHGQFTAKDIEDIEDNTDTGGEPRNRRFISWLNSKIKSRFIYSRNDPVENTRSSPTERDAISIATIEDCPVYSKVVRLSSTPHQASKHKIQRDVYLDMEELQIEIPSHYVDSIDIVENTPPIPDVMYERTGVAMSPISCQLPSEMWDFTDCDECVETRRVQMVNETTDA